MIRHVWRQLKPFTASSGRRLQILAVVATVNSLAEAAALLLAVRVALSISLETERSVGLPLVAGELGNGTAIAIATVCGIVALIGQLGLARLSAGLASTVLARARRAAAARFVEAGWPTQALQREGSLQETMTSLSQRSSALAQALAIGLANTISLGVFVIAALLVDPGSAIVVIMVGAVLVVALRPVAKSTRRRSRIFVEGNSRLAEDISRLTSTSMELRVFGVQREAQQELNGAIEDVRAKQYRARFAMLVGGSLYKNLAVLALVAAVGVLTTMETNAVGDIGVVVTLMVRSLASAQAANKQYQTINEDTPSLESLTRRLEVLAAGALPGGSTAIGELRAIEFRDVGYQYTPGVEALSNVSFEVEFGDALGIIGPSGGGKSTLLQVLLRLRHPTTGAVIVNGVDYRGYDEASWANVLAMVPQEPTLLEASVADNIRYYREIPDEQLEWAAREANVFDDIMLLPNGMDAQLGPRGSGLSGGQKQRVAIARALAGRPQLLVLDEPSSTLDVRSEQLLQATLSRLKGSTTLVIVAHRMKTVEACDRLLVLEGGRIAELGTPDELLNSKGFYRQILHTLQQ